MIARRSNARPRRSSRPPPPCCRRCTSNPRAARALMVPPPPLSPRRTTCSMRNSKRSRKAIVRKPETGDRIELDGVIKPPVCDGTGGLLLWTPCLTGADNLRVRDGEAGLLQAPRLTEDGDGSRDQEGVSPAGHEVSPRPQSG